MGNFYHALHVRHPEDAAVHRSLDTSARRLKFRCWTAPRAGLWITCFPDDIASIGEAARSLSRELRADVLVTMVHDSDVFYYLLARGGAEIDEFASNPKAFGGAGAAARGKPAVIADLLAAGFSRDALDAWFRSAAETQPEESMQRFHELLGIGPALTSYDYLDGGERDGISHWSSFIHFPDLAAEKAAQKAQLDRIRATKLAWIEQGRLRFDSTLKRGRNAWQNFEIHGPHPSGGFVASHFDGSSTLLHWTPPEPPRPLTLAPGDIPHLGQTSAWLDTHTLMVSSERGPVAIDVLTGERRALPPGVEHVFHAVDAASNTGYLSRREDFVGMDLASGRIKFVYPRGPHIYFQVHPQKPHLVWWGQRELGIVDKTSGREITRIEVRNPGIVPKKAAQWRVHSRNSTHIPDLDREDLLSLDLTPDGEHLLAGTTEGLRVYRYRDFLAAGNAMPTPTLAAETCEELQDHRAVNALFFEPARRIVIFSSGDDSLRALALDSGNVWLLAEALDQSRLFSLVRSGDMIAARRRGYLNLRRRESDFSYQVWNLAALLDAPDNLLPFSASPPGTSRGRRSNS